ncbi:MAG: amino acid adenylation domain-containing protein [Actinomycetota bacterium]|nr:amino acid adenylation domain-containing protein [Actinomycetota bacterium]MDQ2955632.1 amino acid adenylation domain-containing protein [Actinomycetota bacterium]
MRYSKAEGRAIRAIGETRTARSTVRTIHGAFAERVAQRPEATALIGIDRQLSYTELDQESDAIAKQLSEAGVTEGCFVPVLLHRTPVLIATLLAVLKCGASYAALDPRWPEDRIAAILDQLAPPVLVSTESSAPRGIPVLSPDSPCSQSDLGRHEWPAVAPDAVAAVFFTSGTTGAPKGVLSSHTAATRLFTDGGLPGFDEAAVVSQTAPAAWDAFSLEVWGALTTGGTLVLSCDEYFLPSELAQLHDDHGVNCTWLTASLFNLFVDSELDCFTGIEHLYIGGERLSVDHVRRFLERFPEAKLFNGYGPVESCVFATVHRITLADCTGPAEVPIGQSVPETEVHVRADGRPCQPGEVGEILLGGSGLAHGYLGNPVLTAERFPTVAIDDMPTRLYATGDRGSWDVDGVLHFHGRADRQIKIRGHRLELAEIERAARGLDEVAHCIVLPVTDHTGNIDRLALAYTCRTPSISQAALTAAEVSELRRQLARSLPDYAVPGVILRLASLPTTANGKLDQASLVKLVSDQAQKPSRPN